MGFNSAFKGLKCTVIEIYKVILWSVRVSNPGGDKIFPYLSIPVLGPTQPPIQWLPSLSGGR